MKTTNKKLLKKNLTITIFFFNNYCFNFFHYFLKLHNIKFKKNKNLLVFEIKNFNILKDFLNFSYIIENFIKTKNTTNIVELDKEFYEDLMEQNLELSFIKINKKYGVKYKAKSNSAKQHVFYQKSKKSFLIFTTKNFNFKIFNKHAFQGNNILFSKLPYHTIMLWYILTLNILKLLNLIIWFRKFLYLKLLKNANNTPN